MSQFTGAAAGQDRNNGKRWIQAVAPRKSVACLRGLHRIHEGMADPIRLDAGFGVEILLEWENAQRPRKAALPPAHSPGPPSPKLRADKIDVTNLLATKNARQPQVKGGKICQDREFGATPVDL